MRSGIYAHDFPLYLQGTHRGRPPWESLRLAKAAIWLLLSIMFMYMVSV